MKVLSVSMIKRGVLSGICILKTKKLRYFGGLVFVFNCCLDSLVGALPMLFTHWGKVKMKYGCMVGDVTDRMPPW